jgi:predicted SAM-dependent methyltransferase
MIHDQIKYLLTAMVLKALAICPRFYRWLGNTVAARKRVRDGLPRYYPGRAKRFLARCEKHQAIRNGDRILEVGTGWVHWESIVIRLFYDVEVTLFDVWDNRQLEAIKRYFAQLEYLIGAEIKMDGAQRRRIHHLSHVIAEARSFDDLYQSLGFQYVIDESGTLRQFHDESFDFVYSHNVLEHVYRGTVPELTCDFCRVLKPGGFSIHSIDLTDHLVSLARIHRLSKKHYLRYPDENWRRYFENRVQYFNRIQRPEWLDLFQGAGLELVEEVTGSCHVDSTKVAEVYRRMDMHDLQCNRLLMVHRKPH